MTGEDFTTQCWRCVEVRQFIVDHAKRHGKHNHQAQQDYVQEAWLAISTVPHCYGVDGCKYLAERTIYSAYWQENKTRLLNNNPGFVGSVDNTDGWSDCGDETVRTALRRLTPSELSSAIVSQIIELVTPELEKLGWKHC